MTAGTALYEEKCLDLQEWVSEIVAHRLAKKLSAEEVEILIRQFHRIATEAKYPSK